MITPSPRSSTQLPPTQLRFWQFVWLLTPLVLGLIVIGGRALHEAWSTAHQQIAVGSITAHLETNHDQYRYAFSAQGQRYEGIDHIYIDDPILIGQNVTVYFDSTNPSINGLEDLGETSRDTRNLAIGLFAVVVLLSGFLLLVRMKSRHEAFTAP